MAIDNVTPIRSGAPPPPATPGKLRKRRAKPGLVLSQGGAHDGYTTLDALYGLHGVCQVLSLHGDDNDVEDGELAAAAHVLASILRSRVEL